MKNLLTKNTRTEYGLNLRRKKKIWCPSKLKRNWFFLWTIMYEQKKINIKIKKNNIFSSTTQWKHQKKKKNYQNSLQSNKTKRCCQDTYRWKIVDFEPISYAWNKVFPWSDWDITWSTGSTFILPKRWKFEEIWSSSSRDMNSWILL